MPEINAQVEEALLELDIDDCIDTTLLTGGMVNSVWLIARANHDPVVLKTTQNAPDNLYAIEAEGLDQLRELGKVQTPSVLGVSHKWLLLEAFTSNVPSSDAFWESAGRATATLHSVRGERFGWPHDGWLGLLPQYNRWSEDGHSFFAEQRILRYLPEPKVEALLTARERKAIEYLCTKLPEIVPAVPPSLTHGDLWQNNLLATSDAEPVFIDPAVSWMWPEVDLSMMYCVNEAASPAFFEAYNEIRPLESGWRERMPLLFLRELLSMLAHEGDVWDCLNRIRQIIKPFDNS